MAILYSCILPLSDVAQLALHQCVERTYYTDGNGCSKIATICYSYEFLDDFVTPKPTVKSFLAEFFQQYPSKGNETIMTNETPYEEMETKFKPTVQCLQHADDESAKEMSLLECEDNCSWEQEKFNPNNHPLELMVSK